MVVTSRKDLIATKYCLLISLYFMFICCYTPVTFATENKSFPLPIQIDYSYYVKSSIYLRCSYEPYDIPLSEFKDKENSQVALRFKRVLSDIRDHNMPTFAKLSPRLAQNSKGPQKQTSLLIENLVTGYNSLLSPEVVGQDFNRINIIQQFYVGTDQIVVWGVDQTPGSDNALIRSFVFKKDQQDNLLWEAGPPNEIHCLIDEIMQQSAESPHVFSPVDTTKFDYEYPIPGTTSGYPAYLQFNGKICDLNVFSDTVATTDPVLTFYQNAYRLFKNSPEAIADLYTPESAQKYRSWLKKADPNYISRLHADTITKGRKVIFLLNADPVFIVFYQPIESARKDFADVRYEYIVKDPKSNQLRLTNLNYNGFLSQYFDNKELFINSFLKPLIDGNTTLK
jgi:hypothetical protein